MLTTPVMRCLKLQVPGIQVHYLTKSQFQPILSVNPYIDKVITLKNSLSETINELKQEKYDQVIDLHHNLRTLQVKLGLKLPVHSFKKLNFQKWLLVTFKKNLLPDKHIVDRYLDTTAHLGVKNDGQGLDYFIPAGESITGLLPESHNNGYIAFAIGGQHNTKKLPNHKIVDTANNIRLPLVLLGGKEDAANGDAIINSTTNKQAINLCGKLSLHQSALAVKQSKGLITHDTGMMHIAAALDVPILSVWGNTVPEFGMYPYYRTNSGAALKAKMFEITLPCRPCSKIGYEKCPLGHFKCMEEQDTRRIGELADKL